MSVKHQSPHCIRCNNTPSVLTSYYPLLQTPLQRKVIIMIRHFWVHVWIISEDISTNCAVFTQCVAVNQYKLIDFMQQQTHLWTTKEHPVKCNKSFGQPGLFPWPGEAYTTSRPHRRWRGGSLLLPSKNCCSTVTFRPHNLLFCTFLNFP